MNVIKQTLHSLSKQHIVLGLLGFLPNSVSVLHWFKLLFCVQFIWCVAMAVTVKKKKLGVKKKQKFTFNIPLVLAVHGCQTQLTSSDNSAPLKVCKLVQLILFYLFNLQIFDRPILLLPLQPTAAFAPPFNVHLNQYIFCFQSCLLCSVPRQAFSAYLPVSTFPCRPM